MYKNLIQSYINNISKNDISKFVETKEINATNKDIDTMYKYITNYKNDLLNNPNKYIEMIKNDVSLCIPRYRTSFMVLISMAFSSV